MKSEKNRQRHRRCLERADALCQYATSRSKCLSTYRTSAHNIEELCRVDRQHRKDHEKCLCVQVRNRLIDMLHLIRLCFNVVCLVFFRHLDVFYCNLARSFCIRHGQEYCRLPRGMTRKGVAVSRLIVGAPRLGSSVPAVRTGRGKNPRGS